MKRNDLCSLWILCHHTCGTIGKGSLSIGENLNDVRTKNPAKLECSRMKLPSRTRNWLMDSTVPKTLWTSIRFEKKTYNGNFSLAYHSQMKNIELSSEEKAFKFLTVKAQPQFNRCTIPSFCPVCEFNIPIKIILPDCIPLSISIFFSNFRRLNYHPPNIHNHNFHRHNFHRKSIFIYVHIFVS